MSSDRSACTPVELFAQQFDDQRLFTSIYSYAIRTRLDLDGCECTPHVPQ